MLKKIFICIMIIASFSSSLVSCIESDTAEDTVKDLLNAIESENYSEAEKLLHPEKPINLRRFFENEEAEERVDFQSGIEIVRYSSVKSSHYDTEVNGSVYETAVQVKIGGVAAELEFEIVDNDKGYGIYDIDIDINE